MKLVCCIATLAISATLFADSNGTISGGKITKPPTVDGTIDPSEWAEALTDQGAYDYYGAAMDPKTLEFWIGYDENYIYFSARCLDPETTKILRNEYRRGLGTGGDDKVSLQLDTEGNNTEFHEFDMNPWTGNSVDIPGGRANKSEWRGEFESSGRITETGWEVEARIPWKIMKLPAGGKRDLRFNVERFVPHRDRLYRWRHTRNDPNAFGRWAGVEIPTTAQPRKLRILPYSYLGGGDNEKPIQDSGFDLKTEIRRNQEIAMTVNPDFRNIENDVLSLDFSYFERIGNETRPFFQEGAQYFNPAGAIFRSQTIRSIDSGLKYYGKANAKTNFGVMNLMDFGDTAATVMAVSSNTSQRHFSSAAITDYRQKGIVSNGYRATQLIPVGKAGTFAMSTAASTDSVRGTGWQGGVDYRQNNKETGYNIGINLREQKFNPRLSPAFDRDFKGAGGMMYSNKNYESGMTRDLNLYANADLYWRWDGDPYRRSLGFGASTTFRNGLSSNVGVELSRFLQFDDQLVYASFGFPSNNPYNNVRFGANYGHISGKPYQSQRISTTRKPFQNLVVSLSAEFNRHFKDSTQWIGSMNWDLGKDQSLSSRAVKSNKDTNWYLSYRKAGGKGSEYFLILGDPNSESFQKQVILKVVTPIDIRF